MASTSPKPFVFVLMPFDKTLDDVYTLGINAACKDAGAFCERVDKQIFTESILERIYNQISKADIIVSDMTGRNPNVFYEAGYAHALGKRTILLTQNAEDIPFDLSHYPHIVYGESISFLKDELKKRVRYFLDHPEKTQQVGPDALEYYIEGIDICKNNSVYIYHNLPILKPNVDYGAVRIHITLGIHNPNDGSIDTSSMQFGLVFPRELGLPLEETFIKLPEMRPMTASYAKLPDQKIITTFPGPKRILPKGWYYVSVGYRFNPFELDKLVKEKNIMIVQFAVSLNLVCGRSRLFSCSQDN